MERDLRYRLNWMKGIMAIWLGAFAGVLVLGGMALTLQRLHVGSPEGQPFRAVASVILSIYLMIGLSSLAAGVTAAWHQCSWPERFHFRKRGGAYAFWVAAGMFATYTILLWRYGIWKLWPLLLLAVLFVPLAGLIGRRVERR